jgi:hypothetical protein
MLSWSLRFSPLYQLLPHPSSFIYLLHSNNLGPLQFFIPSPNPRTLSPPLCCPPHARLASPIRQRPAGAPRYPSLSPSAHPDAPLLRFDLTDAGPPLLLLCHGSSGAGPRVGVGGGLELGPRWTCGSHGAQAEQAHTRRQWRRAPAESRRTRDPGELRRRDPHQARGWSCVQPRHLRRPLLRRSAAVVDDVVEAAPPCMAPGRGASRGGLWPAPARARPAIRRGALPFVTTRPGKYRTIA